MEKIIKLIDFLEEKTEELKGEVISQSNVKKTNIINYIEKRIKQLIEKSEKDNLLKLSAKNEINFLLKLKERLINE